MALPRLPIGRVALIDTGLDAVASRRRTVVAVIPVVGHVRHMPGSRRPRLTRLGRGERRRGVVGGRRGIGRLRVRRGRGLRCVRRLRCRGNRSGLRRRRGENRRRPDRRRRGGRRRRGRGGARARRDGRRSGRSGGTRTSDPGCGRLAVTGPAGARQTASPTVLDGVEARGDDRDPDLVAEGIVDHRTEDDVRFGMGGVRDQLGRGVDLEQTEIGTTRDVQQHALGAVHAGLEER